MTVRSQSTVQTEIAPEDTRAFREAVREGLADADAGQTISFDRIRRWLLSWGTDNELPPPE